MESTAAPRPAIPATWRPRAGWRQTFTATPFPPACAECSGRHDATERASGPNPDDSSDSGSIVRGVCAVPDIERIELKIYTISKAEHLDTPFYVRVPYKAVTIEN